MHLIPFHFQELSIEYRAGSHSTTLFIFTPFYQDVKAMEQLFGMLASNATKQVDLHTLSGVKLQNLDALILQTEAARHTRRAIEVTPNQPQVELQWTMSVDAWDLCQALLHAFEPEQPGFQYLNDEPAGNPVIVFAYKTND
jgi:hypothetical protein